MHWIKAIYTLHRWEQEAAPLAEKLLATEGCWERKSISLGGGAGMESHPPHLEPHTHAHCSSSNERLEGEGKHCRVRPKCRGCGVDTVCTCVTDDESVQTTTKSPSSCSPVRKETLPSHSLPCYLLRLLNDKVLLPKADTHVCHYSEAGLSEGLLCSYKQATHRPHRRGKLTLVSLWLEGLCTAVSTKRF